MGGCRQGRARRKAARAESERTDVAQRHRGPRCHAPFWLDPGSACPLPLSSGASWPHEERALRHVWEHEMWFWRLSQTLVQDTLTPSVTLSVLLRAGVRAGWGGPVQAAAWSVAPRRCPAGQLRWLFFHPPVQPTFHLPLPAYKLVSTGVPHLARVFFDHHPLQALPTQDFERTRPFCLWLSVFFPWAPGPVVLLAAGWLALLLAAGLCPCQESIRTWDQGWGRVL